MTVEIEILYFEGCPAHEETAELVRETVDRLAVEAEIVETAVETDEQARQLGFVGSPTVRVDGDDIEPGVDADEATVGRGCRVYSTSNGHSAVPPAEMVEAALPGESAGT